MLTNPEKAIAAIVSAIPAVAFSQWFVTSPGRYTPAEDLALIATTAACLVGVSAAHWAERGRPLHRRERPDDEDDG